MTLRRKIVTPKRPPRAIVSVPFERADFERVERAAHEAGMPISRYIRERTLLTPVCMLHEGQTEGAEIHLWRQK